jgi:hypothetical protein
MSLVSDFSLNFYARVSQAVVCGPMEILGGLLGGQRRYEGSFGTKIFTKFYLTLNE